MAQRCQRSTGCLLLLSFAYPPTHRLVIVVPVFSCFCCFPFSCFSLFWFFFLFLCLQLLVVWPIFLLASVMMRGFCNNRGSHLSLSIHGGPWRGSSKELWGSIIWVIELAGAGASHAVYVKFGGWKKDAKLSHNYQESAQLQSKNRALLAWSLTVVQKRDLVVRGHWSRF